jgi:hypothetical protein
MALEKIQEEFEKIVLINKEDDLFLDKFEDGESWVSEDLTNCYQETITEMCFHFFKLGENNKERKRFESEILLSCGKEEDFTLIENGNYKDDYINILWKYFNLS